MATTVTHRDILWGYIATVLSIGSGLVLLPVVLHYLPAEDVGLWLVFTTLAGLAQILEIGFQSTITRNTAYIYAGAQSLLHEGLSPENNPRDLLNAQLLADLVKASRIIYRVVAALAAIVLLGGGTVYILTVLTARQDTLNSLYAWWAYALGSIATIYYNYFNALLQGRGDIAAANKTIVITRGLQLILSSSAIMLGYGLLGMGAASLISNIIGRWVARRYYFSNYRHEVMEIQTIHAQPAKIIKTLWHNASRIGFVTFSSFLIQRASVLLASSFLGLATAASYGMTITIFLALTGMSVVILQVQLPYISALQAARDQSKLRDTYGSILIIAWMSFVTALGVLVLWGNIILGSISSNVLLLPVPQLIVLGLIYLLELNNGLAGGYLTTINKVPFVRAIWWSGLAILTIALVLLALCGLGIWGLIIAHGAVQLAYNNWKWPKEAVNHLGGNFRGILKNGAKKIARQFGFRF